MPSLHGTKIIAACATRARAAGHHRRRVVAQAGAAHENIADCVDPHAAAYLFHPHDEKLARLAVQLRQREPAYAAFPLSVAPILASCMGLIQNRM
jgi:hypothetical protein